MDFKVKRPKNEYFYNLEIGTFFLYGGDIYFKTEERGSMNCVCLNSKTLESIEENTHVSPLVLNGEFSLVLE